MSACELDTADLGSKHIQFQPFTPKDIVRISEVEVSSPELYKNHDNGTRTTCRDGVLDARMVRLAIGARLMIGTERERCQM